MKFFFVALVIILGSFIGNCSLTTYTPEMVTPVGTVVRADTRKFIGFRYGNEEVRNQTIDIFRNAPPNETAVCYYGYAKDTTFIASVFNSPTDSVEVSLRIAVVDDVKLANIDSAGVNYVTYIDKTACDPNKRLIAIAHNHPRTPPWASCKHSPTDILFDQGKEEKYWFSIVFCGHEAHILWADGRRHTIRL